MAVCVAPALGSPNTQRLSGWEGEAVSRSLSLGFFPVRALYVGAGCLLCVVGMMGSPGGSLLLSEENLLVLGAGGRRAAQLRRGNSP